MSKMSDLKGNEEFHCCCCIGNGELFNMLQPYYCEGGSEIYSNMIAECFRIKIKYTDDDDDEYMKFFKICKACASRLKGAVQFRYQIQKAYNRIKDIADRRSTYSSISDTNLKVNYEDISVKDFDPSSKEQIKYDKNDREPFLNRVTSEDNEIQNWSYLNFTHICYGMNCCCCFNKENLSSMMEPLDCERAPEILITVIAECFQIKLKSRPESSHRNMYMMCKNCIYRLKDALHLRFQIQMAFDRIRGLNKRCISGTEESFYTDTNITNKNTLGETSIKIDHFQCTSCDKTFKNNKYLKQHMKIHMNDRKFICNICDRAFIYKQQQKNHILSSHLGIKKEKCEVCGKLFVLKAVLAQHMKIHLNIKNFICDMCGKAFIRKNKLVGHILSHMGIKKAKCKVCKKLFVSNSNLKRHMKLH